MTRVCEQENKGARMNGKSMVFKRNSEEAVLRRLEVFRKNGFFGQDTRGARIRRAISARDYFKVFRFVHDTYVQCGWIRPSVSALRIRPWDLCPSTAVFLAEFEEKVVGSLIVVGDTPDLGLPIDNAFRDVTDSLRGPGRSMAEMGVQIVAPAFRRGSLLTELQRCAYAHLAYSGYTDLLTIVSPVQRHFMEIMGLRTLSEPRRWSPGLEDLVVLVAGDRPSFERQVTAQGVAPGSLDDFRCRFLMTENPYTERVASWDAQADDLFEDPSELCELAAQCFDLWNSATPREQRVLARHVGAFPSSTMFIQRSA
jgi:hypothetical protein